MKDELEKRTKTIEGKRPWEAGFEEEQQEQKEQLRKEKGQKADTITDSSMYQKTQQGD